MGGVEPQKQIKVELIEWRSIDLCSIDFKSTLCLPQRGKCTGTSSPCLLGVRLRYQRHGEHGLKVRSEDKHFQYWSVPQKVGFAPRSFHFVFCYALIKNYLGNLYTVGKILLCSFRWCSSFLLHFRHRAIQEPTYHTNNISLKGCPLQKNHLSLHGGRPLSSRVHAGFCSLPYFLPVKLLLPTQKKNKTPTPPKKI